MSNNTNNSYLVAGAIVIAGALIAVGVFMSGDKTPANPDDNNERQDVVTEEISINPITADDHIVGDLGAKVTIVEYSDTECPFCKNFHEVLDQITQTYPGDQVAWVYRHFPLTSIHPKAPREAHATECAAELGGNEGFWNYINKIYEVTPSNNGLDLNILPDIAKEVGLDVEAFNACQDEERYLDAVGAQFEDAVGSGGTGTPYNVFVLSEEMSETAQQGISAISGQFGPGSVRVSEDNMRIAISGGLSFEATSGIIDILLDEDAGHDGAMMEDTQ